MRPRRLPFRSAVPQFRQSSPGMNRIRKSSKSGTISVEMKEIGIGWASRAPAHAEESEIPGRMSAPERARRTILRRWLRRVRPGFDAFGVAGAVVGQEAPLDSTSTGQILASATPIVPTVDPRPVSHPRWPFTQRCRNVHRVKGRDCLVDGFWMLRASL